MTRPGQNVPALVLGTGITALGVIRRLGRLGVHGYLVSDRPAFIRGSRWYRPTRLLSAPEPGDLPEWLAALPIERAALIPCSDTWLEAVASLPAAVSARFPASVPPQATARRLVDKLLLAELLENAGVPHPRTVELRTPADWERIDVKMKAETFLKPVQSQQFFEVFHRKAFTIGDPGEDDLRIAAALERGLGLVVQEMIPGPADHQLCVDGFVDRGGNVRARFARRWLRKYPGDFGESCLAVSIPLDEVAEGVELADRTIGLLPYRGVFSVELKKDPRDGRYRVLEVNARPWWYIGFTCRAGVDVCRMAYQDALGETIETVEGYQVGLQSAYPELDWHAVRSMPPAERPGMLRLVSTWLRAVQPVFSWDDPGPQLLVFLTRIRRRLARLLVRLRNRTLRSGAR